MTASVEGSLGHSLISTWMPYPLYTEFCHHINQPLRNIRIGSTTHNMRYFLSSSSSSTFHLLHQVPEGHVGVYWRGGALLKIITDPGFHLKFPLITYFEPIQVTLQTDQADAWNAYNTTSLGFAYNTGMLPEIQATVKPPAVKNMEKALWFQFTVGVIPLYDIVFMGYWAYGSSTSSYLLNSVSGPIWVKTVANIAAFLQTVVALHIFASPMYEYLDTKYGSGKGSAFSFQNISFRVLVRGGYLTINTLVAAMLPFLGDFMSLTGSLSMYPLTYVLSNHMYLKVKENDLSATQKAWHWLNVVGFSCLSAAGAVAALRLVAVDSKTYHLFADL